jgi:hypothetical protein
MDKKLERRTCQRFVIPGATVGYKEEGSFFKKGKSVEEEFPISNLSRGGVIFLTQKQIKLGTKLLLSLTSQYRMAFAY